MRRREKIAFYPLAVENVPFVKHFNELQSGYELAQVIAPSGKGVEGLDIGSLVNFPDTGYIITNQLDETTKDWDILLVFELANETECLKEQKIKYITKTLEFGKNVQFITNKKNNFTIEIENLKKKYPHHFTVVSEECLLKKNQNQLNFEEMGQVDTPVILVGGLIEDDNVTEVLIQLTLKIRSEGMYVNVISPQKISGFFGFYTLNDIFNDYRLSEIEKIEKIALFAKEIEFQNRPDIILIQAPGALIKFNRCATNGFGLKTYMLTQAIRPDYLISCFPYELIVKGFIEEINEDFKIRYGCGISSIQVSNIVVDAMATIQKKKVSYAYNAIDIVMELLENHKIVSGIPVFNILRDGIEPLYHSLQKS